MTERAMIEPRTSARVVKVQGEVAIDFTVAEGAPLQPGEVVRVWLSRKALARLVREAKAPSGIITRRVVFYGPDLDQVAREAVEGAA